MLMKPLVLALTVLGAEPDGLPAPAPMVATQVRVLEMKNLSWRSSAHAQLTPVSRRDAATVWTAPAEILETLEQGASQVIQAPKVNAVAGLPAQVKTARVRHFVADTKFIQKTLEGGKTGVAYLPNMGQASEGLRFEVVARPIDQGTLAKIELENTHIGAIHAVPVNDPRGDDAPSRLNGMYQVPEVVREQVSGEWVIPKDGLLIIGLGPQTTKEADGKATVRERVVIVQATPGSGPAGAVSPESVMGREVIYSSPAFAAPLATPRPGSATTATRQGASAPFDFAQAVPKPPIEPTASQCQEPNPHNGHVGIHPVHVLAALPWNAIPGPVGTAAQARILGIGGPVVQRCQPSSTPQNDQMVRRTAAEAEAAPTDPQPMPRVPSRTLPGTITPDGTRAILPPLPDHDADTASYDPSGEPRPSPQTLSRSPENVKIHGKVVIRGADGVELIADGLTIRTLPKQDTAVAPTSATLKPSEPVTPPCCDVSDKEKDQDDKEKGTGWSKPKDVAATPPVAVGSAPLKLRLPNSQGAVELEIHAAPTP